MRFECIVVLLPIFLVYVIKEHVIPRTTCCFSRGTRAQGYMEKHSLVFLEFEQVVYFEVCTAPTNAVLDGSSSFPLPYTMLCW